MNRLNRLVRLLPLHLLDLLLRLDLWVHCSQLFLSDPSFPLLRIFPRIPYFRLIRSILMLPRYPYSPWLQWARFLPLLPWARMLQSPLPEIVRGGGLVRFARWLRWFPQPGEG